MTDPQGPVLRWVREVLSAQVRLVETLPGATTATVVAVEARGARYVVKVFSEESFIEEDPERAVHEAAVLEAVEGCGIPAPQLVAVDGDGSSCGVPAVLMTQLPGDRGVSRDHARQLVDIAARIHTLAVDVPWPFIRYNQGCATAAPAWGRDGLLWEEAVTIAASDPPAGATGFIHRDYNSTNFLTRGGTVTGVVDWLSACRGPLGIDAARLRLDLTVDGRRDLAADVTSAFRNSGHDVVDPFWDVVDAVDLLPFYQGREAVDRWSEADPARRNRLEWFVRDAMRYL